MVEDEEVGTRETGDEGDGRRTAGGDVTGKVGR